MSESLLTSDEFSTILSCNIEGLCPYRMHCKVDMLRERAVSSGAAVIGVVESHLRDDICDAEVNMEGFQLYRADRTRGRKKGGAALYIRNDLASSLTVITAASDGVVEHLAVWIRQLNLVVVVVYRPPTCEMTNFGPSLDLIRSKIEGLGTPMQNIVILGDFNFPSMCWKKGAMYGGTNESRLQVAYLQSFMEDFALEQCVTEATRQSNILDLFITNNSELIRAITVEDTIMSDHRLISVRADLGIGPAQPDNRQLRGGILGTVNFKSSLTDWESMRQELGGVDWEARLSGKSAQNIYLELCGVLHEICPRHAPLRRTPKQAKSIPRDRKILMRKRTRTRKRLLLTSETLERQRLITKDAEIELKLTQSHKLEAAKLEERAVVAIRENPKSFYGYVRTKSTTKSMIGPFQVDGRLVSDPMEKSVILKAQYESAFSIPVSEEAGSDVDQAESGDLVSLGDLYFSENDIVESIKELNPSSASGPDGVPAVLLRNCREELKLPLYRLWRTSLDTGSLPDEMKLGIITPIFKGGERELPKNYRPIALTSHIVKVFEKIVVKKLSEYLEGAGLFNDNQHGFRHGKSCLSQLLEHQRRILEARGRGRAVDVIYLDFAKAFDKVDHKILLRKLSLMGVGGGLLDWIQSFLTNRRQAVAVDGCCSPESTVVSGVPQGSVLGPLLFLVHISDIDSGLRFSQASSFADDTRLLMEVAGEQNCEDLQEDLNRIYEWARENNMCFNSSKFELLRYGPHPDASYEYKTSDGHGICQKHSLRDLGVTMEDGGGFGEHLGGLVSRCRRQMGWIWRTFKTREPTAMLTLFRSLVLPLAEYCCQLWCPSAQGQITLLEGIQRTFTARIIGFQHLDYWERLEALSLFSLQRRRERYLIIYVWKIIVGLVPNFLDQCLRISTKEHIRLGRLCVVPPFNSRALASVRTMHERSFSVMGPRLFNCLPMDLRAYEGTVDGFKAKLGLFLKTVPDKPPLPHYHQPAAGNSLLQQLAHLRAQNL